MIKFYCSVCGKGLNAPDGSEGKRARCPKCKTVNAVPVGHAGAPPQPAAPLAPPVAQPVVQQPPVAAPVPPAQPIPQQPPVAQPQPVYAAAPVYAPVPDEVDMDLAALANATAVSDAEHRSAVSSGRRPRATSARQRRMLKGRNRDAGKVFSVFCGLFLLLTVIIPWFVMNEPTGFKITMSWHLLNEANVVGKISMVALWVMGLAAIITGLVAPSFVRSIVHLSIGGLMLVIAMVGMLTGGSALLFMGAGGSAIAVIVQMLAFLFAIALIVLCHIRGVVGMPTPMRVAIGVVSNIMLLSLLGQAVVLIMGYSEAESSTTATMAFLFALLFNIALISACILAMCDAFMRKGKLTTLSLVIQYVTYFAILIFTMIMSAVTLGHGGAVPAIINGTLIMVGTIGLFGTGVVGIAINKVADREDRENTCLNCGQDLRSTRLHGEETCPRCGKSVDFDPVPSPPQMQPVQQPMAPQQVPPQPVAQTQPPPPRQNNQ